MKSTMEAVENLHEDELHAVQRTRESGARPVGEGVELGGVRTGESSRGDDGCGMCEGCTESVRGRRLFRGDNRPDISAQ